MSSVNTSADIAPDRSGETAWLTLFAGFVLSSGLLVAAGDNIGQQILAMFVLMVASGLAVRFDIAHPLVWFAGAFTLYSISGPLLQYLGVHPYDTWGGYRIQELDFSGAMDFQFLALLVAVMVIGPYRQSFAGAMKHRDAITLFDGAMPVLISATVIGIANVYQIVSQDFGSKGDVVLSGDWTTRLSFAFNIAATALGVYLAKLFCEGRPVSAYVTLTIVIAVGIAMVLLIGQRHFLFRAGLICLLVFHIFHQRISIRSLLLLALFALTLSTVLGGYKMSLVVQDAAPLATGSLWERTVELIAIKNPEFLNDSPWLQYTKVGLAVALGSEAMTPGNNMAMLLSRVPHDLPYFYGSTIPGDLLRSVLPGFLIQPLVQTTGTTYNALVFPNTAVSGGGVGFTIAGYGYLHFGVFGLVMVMASVGLALRMSYRWASRTPLGLMFFIGFFPVAIYIARNDITGPLSQGLKHVLLPLLAMYVAAYFFAGRQARHRQD